MTNTINNVPRELLERCAQYTPTLEKQEGRARALSELRALLSAPSPAGVDGLEVVAYIWSHEKGITVPTMRNKPPFWPGKGGYTSEPLCRLSYAQAIIDGLRGEVASLENQTDEMNAALTDAYAEYTKQYERIGELEGLLREARDTYRAAIHWEDLRGTMKRIDAALSAGKEGE